MRRPMPTYTLAALVCGMAVAGGMTLGGCGGVDPANALIGSKRAAQDLEVKMQMRGIGDAMYAEYVSSDLWPLSLEELAAEGTIKPSDLEDPWGNDLVYAPPETTGDNPVFYSFGPDGESGTADDIDHVWP